MAQTVKRALADTLVQLDKYSTDELLERRYKRLMSYGRFEESA